MSSLADSSPKPTLEDFFAKKNLAETSKRKYIHCVEIIKKLTDYKNDDIGFMNRVATFARQVKKTQYAMNTIKSVYIVWYSIAQVFPTFCFKRTLQELKEQMERYNAMTADQMATNQPNEAYDTWDFAEASEFVSSLPSTNYNEALTRTIVALYTLQPPIRLDYSGMMVYNRYTSRLQSEEHENFCIFNDKQGFFFVLNTFKTKRTIGRFVSRTAKPGSQLHLVLRQWFRDWNKSIYLLADEYGKPVSRESIAYRLKTAFQTYKGLNIGIRQLRRIYETELIHSPDYQRMTLLQKKEEHRQLLHSFEMGHAYGLHGEESEADAEAES